MAWKNDFLKSVSQVVFSDAVSGVREPICYSLNEKLEELKRNIVSKTCLDPYEFPSVFFDNMYDTENEETYLLKIKHSLDVLSQLPIGRDILSNVWSKTCFSVAPLNNLLGKFCITSMPYVFLDTSGRVFDHPDDTLKILTHELTHAKNEEVQAISGFYSLPPKLYFMCRVFNELSARFNEKIVLAQKVDQEADCNIISQEDAFNMLNMIVQKSYLTIFADKAVKRCRTANEIMVSPDLTEENLTMARYYVKSYPVLKNLALIGEIERLYEAHIMPLACQKWPQFAQKELIVSKQRG